MQIKLESVRNEEVQLYKKMLDETLEELAKWKAYAKELQNGNSDVHPG